MAAPNKKGRKWKLFLKTVSTPFLSFIESAYISKKKSSNLLSGQGAGRQGRPLAEYGGSAPAGVNGIRPIRFRGKVRQSHAAGASSLAYLRFQPVKAENSSTASSAHE